MTNWIKYTLKYFKIHENTINYSSIGPHNNPSKKLTTIKKKNESPTSIAPWRHVRLYEYIEA